MNRNYITAIGVSAGVLTAFALIAFALFEIAPQKEWVEPSREARRNEYLALDRWLKSGGISVRVQSSGDLKAVSEAEENNIFIQSSRFRWNKETFEYLIRRIEDGMNLFLALDYYTMPHNSYLSAEEDWVSGDDEPFLLLEEFGITTETKDSYAGYRWDIESPDFDRRVSFLLSEDQAAENSEVLLIKDWTSFNRLIQVKRGRGTLTVSGHPRFLNSNNLANAPNARIAWAIFAGSDNKDSWFFIRGTTRVRGLLGSLWRHGNFAVLAVSLILLIVIAFWAVLPMFGTVKEEDEKPGKALRERFLAEGRFLRRYSALGLYRDTYIKEIKRILARKEGIIDNEGIKKRVLEIWGRPAEKSALLLKALRGERFSFGEFPKMVIIFKTILEKI